jgi:hypothetical protein
MHDRMTDSQDKVLVLKHTMSVIKCKVCIFLLSSSSIAASQYSHLKYLSSTDAFNDYYIKRLHPSIVTKGLCDV